MRKKRFFAFCLACLMLLSGNTGLFNTIIRAADIKITLSYINSDIGSDTISTVIQGRSAKIKVDRPSVAIESAGGLTIVRTDSTMSEDDIKKFVAIEDENNTRTKVVTVSESMPITTGEATFSIRGNYYAQLSSGTSYESATGGSNTFAGFELSQPLDVYEYSEATLTCISEETALNAARFSFAVGTGGSKNAFSEFDGAQAIAQTRVKNSKDLKVILSKSGKQITVTLHPQQVYEEYDKTDPDNVQVIGNNNYVKENTKFKLTLAAPESNSLILKVLTPEQATLNIANEIQRQTGEPQVIDGATVQPPYLRLAKGDAINYIQQPFSLQNSISQYGADFFMEWQWISDDATTTSVPIGTSGASYLQVVGDDPHGGVVEPNNSNPNGWQTVTLNREYGDVTGRLQALVKYKKTATQPQPDLYRAALLPITIHGTGDPASLTRTKQWLSKTQPDGTNQLTEEQFVGDDMAMPKTFYMDVYDGHLDGIAPPTNPFKYQLTLKMGKGNAASQYAIVELVSGNDKSVSMQTNIDGKLSDYAFGGQIVNPKKDSPTVEGSADLIFTALPTGEEMQRLTLKITFYVKGNKGVVPALVQPEQFSMIINDSSPSDDATLKSMTLKGKLKDAMFFAWKEIDYGFASDKTTYDINLTNDYECITLNPTRNDPNADKNITIKVVTAGGEPEYQAITSGSTSAEIPLEENVPIKVDVTVKAENLVTKTYTLNIMRMPPSADSTLKSLTLYDEKGTEVFNGIKPNVFKYDVEIPFKVQKARVAYVPNHEKATAEFAPELVENGLFTKKEWLAVAEEAKKSQSGREMTLTVTMAPENKNPNDQSIYTFNIIRTPPSDVNTLAELTVMDNKNTVIPYTPAFHPEMDTEDYYELRIPYSTGKIRVQAKPTDSGATVLLKGKGVGGLLGGDEQELGANTPSKPFEVSPYDESIPDDYYEMVLEVWPESVPVDSVPKDSNEYRNKVMKYPIHVYRDPPSKDATLKSLVIADQDSKEIIYDFDSEVTRYTIDVPYEVQKVKFTPTAAYDNVSKIMINNRKVKNGETSSLFPLNSDTSINTEFTITVTPEDTSAPSKVYTVIFKQKPPNSDARLIKLEVGNATDFAPIFMPSKTAYTAKVAAGAEGVTVTATANDPNAKIKIDGKPVESGKASELIRILEVKQKVQVVVTAQDGKTQMTYTITFTNENYIEKTNNADLKRLEVQYGAMRPEKFKASVTEYEVSVDEETYSVELLPKTADQYATMKVFSGTKEIGDYRGNYASSIQDGENEFTIEVTSSDGTKKKDYVVTVYRGDEDKMGNLKPITTDDIDFELEDDLILIDISKYSRVGRDVFEKLKEYPEKTIIFQGNDYSLQFNGKDLDEIIPHVEYFDFGMSFDSPLADEIMDEIDSHGHNDEARIVLIYFKYHGDLPAPATLTMSLGRHYRNEKMYWYYYNEDYQRMDYYGSFNTNSRGTFSVTLDHMSTYAASDMKLSGAENRTQGQTDVNLSSKSEQQKINPATGRRQ